MYIFSCDGNSYWISFTKLVHMARKLKVADNLQIN